MRRTTLPAALLCVLVLAATASPAPAAVTGGAYGETGGTAARFDLGQIGADAPDAPPDTVSPGGPSPGREDVATLVDGVAYAPRRAPLAVKAAIRAANRLRNKPYVWGGGHASFRARGYDCSGAVSYVLHAAGLLAWPETSGALAHWGAAGEGRWITVYANKGHAFMVIAGARFDTSGAGSSGPRWRSEARWMRGFRARHAPGL